MDGLFAFVIWMNKVQRAYNLSILSALYLALGCLFRNFIIYCFCLSYVYVIVFSENYNIVGPAYEAAKHIDQGI